MGVRGLESYIESDCHIFYSVDIKALAQKSRIENPVIIVDLYACVKPLYYGLDVICGGQGLVFLERCRSFVNAFVDAGIKLLWVKDGRTCNSKRDTWIRRRYHSCKDYVEPVFELLKAGIYPDFTKTSSAGPNPNLLLEYIMEDILGQQVIITDCSKDADQVVAEMAKSSDKTLAILSQDTDFIIYQYPVHVPYLSVRHLNFEKLFTDGSLMTKVYDRRGLLDKLTQAAHRIATNRGSWRRLSRFELGHLPYLAALKGNDVIDMFQLSNFHCWLLNTGPTGLNHGRVVEYLAFYILNEGITSKTLTRFCDFQWLSKTVFKTPARASELKSILEGYFLVDSTDESFNQMSEDEKKWQKLIALALRDGTTISTIMNGDGVEQNIMLEDYASADLIPNGIFAQKMRQRAYGVILYEKPDALQISDDETKKFVIKVQEWIMNGPGTVDEAKFATPIVPPGCHPGLEVLWQSQDPSVADIRWKLFAWIISPELNPDLLKNLDCNFLLPVINLFAMQHEWTSPILFDWEVKVFLLQHTRFQKLKLEDAMAISKQICVADPRGVQLATIYTRMWLTFYNKVAGKPIPRAKLLPLVTSFDGILFQTLYKRCKKDKSILNEADPEELDVVDQYFSLVTDAGTKVRTN